jgi:hypothetical protein
VERLELLVAKKLNNAVENDDDVRFGDVWWLLKFEAYNVVYTHTEKTLCCYKQVK